MGFWDFFWLLIWSYCLFAYLMLLFHVFADLFRDPQLGGFAKGLWALAMIVAPFLGVLVYLIARGHGMAERQAGGARRARAETDKYIQSVAETSSSADEIASAKVLLDDGTITDSEFDRLKVKALA